MVIMPTYNEKDTLEGVIEDILALDLGFYITIVDDNSPDGTGEIADRLASRHPRIHVIHRTEKLGLGTAYIEGFKYALNQGAEYIFEMDSDRSHHPKYLKEMLEQVQKDGDLILGSRYLRGVRVDNWSFRRLLMSKLANLYVQFVAPLPIEDSTSGLRCFKRRVLETINLDQIHSDGYCFQIEMTYRAHRRGFKIVEIPITFYERSGGYSKMSNKIVLEAFWLVLKLRLGLIK
jgi:dolichol-phosphate mannosyltransferase